VKAITKEWINIAEESFSTARMLQRMRHRLRPKVLCFHYREAARKYFIALLEEARLSSKHRRNLLALAVPLIRSDAQGARAQLREFKRFDDRFLYPGHGATRADARAALKACRSIRAEVRVSLGLPKK